MKARWFAGIIFLCALSALCILCSALAYASTTKVGNGDDGSDLEGFDEITSGPLLEARQKAVALLRGLNVQGVAGLGHLIPEIERAPLYMAKRNVSSSVATDQGAFHSDFSGQVFARTMPEPYAPTRFFPVAAKLSEEQLIALHVHEALHRSLPPEVRENEFKVTTLTLAITTPGATFDRVQSVARKEIPEEEPQTAVATQVAPNGSAPLSATVNGGAPLSATLRHQEPIPETARVKHPSSFGYTFHSFRPSSDVALSDLRSMHVVQSFLYPFGNERNPIGIGIEASVLNFEKESQLGPLQLSARGRLWSSRGFDVGAWGTYSLNTLSAEELKNSPYGRDILTVGLSMRKDLPFLYLENVIGYNGRGEARQRVGNLTYTHQYGSVTNAAIRVGGKLGGFRLGGFGDVSVADYYRVTGPGFGGFDTGRYQIVSAGPDIGWESGHFAASVFGKFIVSSSKDATFDYLGNIFSKGSGQGSIGANISIYL